MSHSSDYTETLKKIKETEEASSREILERRKALEEDLRRLESASAASISEAKKKGEGIIASEADKARKAADQKAEGLLATTNAEAKKVSTKKLDKAALKKITEQTILPEFK